MEESKEDRPLARRRLLREVLTDSWFEKLSLPRYSVHICRSQSMHALCLVIPRLYYPLNGRNPFFLIFLLPDSLDPLGMLASADWVLYHLDVRMYWLGSG